MQYNPVISNMKQAFSVMDSLSQHYRLNCKNRNGIQYYFTDSEFALMNGVIVENIADDAIATLFDEMLSYFGKTPFTFWWVSQKPMSSTLQQQLTHLKFQTPGAYRGIALALNSIKFQKNPSTIHVKKVSTHEEYNIFIKILSETFQLSSAIEQNFKKILNSYGENGKFQHYLGYSMEQAVSIVTSFYQNDILGLYCGATLPHAQKKGVFSSLLQHVIVDAQQKGYTSAIAQLMAGDKAGNICERLGFQDHCHLHPFIKGNNLADLEPNTLG